MSLVVSNFLSSNSLVYLKKIVPLQLRALYVCARFKVYIQDNQIVMIKNVVSDFIASGEYITPDVKILTFQSEGVLCGSVTGIGHKDFTMGDSYEI